MIRWLVDAVLAILVVALACLGVLTALFLVWVAAITKHLEGCGIGILEESEIESEPVIHLSKLHEEDFLRYAKVKL